MSEKLCMFCVHYRWDEPYEYSEYTAGGGYMICGKNHHEAGWYANTDTLEAFRKAITTARKCPDYKQVKSDAPVSLANEDRR